MARSSPLPRLFRGRRRGLFLTLLLNGGCQAVAVISIGWLLSVGLKIEGDVIRIEPAMAIGLLVVACALLGLRSAERSLGEELGQLYVTACRTRLFRALTSMPLRGAATSRLGITMTRLITDLTALKNWVGYGVAQLAVAAMSLIAFVLALFLVSPGLAATAANTIALLIIVAMVASVWLGYSIRAARRIRGRLAANVGGLMQSPSVARHFRREEREKKRVRAQSRDLTQALSRWRGIAGLMRALPDASFPLILAAIGLGLSAHPTPLQLDPVALTTSFFLLGLLVSPLRNLVLSLEFFMAYREGRRRLIDAMRRHEAVTRPEHKEFKRLQGPCALRLDGAKGPDGVGPINAALSAGEVALLTGPSGSGKSTLLHVIAGLSDDLSNAPDDPAGILLDGFDFASVSQRQWNARVKLVSPELPLIKGSLRRNLGYGGARMSDDEAWQWLALCGLRADDAMLAGGLDLRIKDGGNNLPADLRSRVQLARALASKPGLLLVDDPVFLAGGEAQDVLRAVLERVELTVIVASPRPSPAFRVDRIWRLDDGQLVDISPARKTDDVAER